MLTEAIQTLRAGKFSPFARQNCGHRWLHWQLQLLTHVSPYKRLSGAEITEYSNKKKALFTHENLFVDSIGRPRHFVRCLSTA